MDTDLLPQVIVNGIMLAMVYIMVALGLTILFGVMHIINFAHGELYMLGGFGVWLLFAERGVNYFAALLIVVTLVAMLGILMERLVLRQFHGDLSGSLIVSLGLLLLLQNGALLAFGLQDRSVPSPIAGKLEVAGAVLPAERLMVIAVGAAMVVALYGFLRWARWGQALRAVAQDREAAALQGIDVGRAAMLTMAIASALAAAAGGLMAPIFTVNPAMGTLPLFKAFVIVILGGLGSIPGVLAAGLILGFAESFATTYAGATEAAMLFFGVLIFILLLRPQGLLGYE